jgi:hypothetical protein
MPLPKPHNKEEKDKFISRCMSDEGMKSEFKNDKQRVAICLSIFKREEKAKESEGKIQWDDIKSDEFTLY